MSKRRTVAEKPHATVSEIVEQDRIIRQGFEARVGAPLPYPAKDRAGAQYVEERVARTVNEFARNGLKAKTLSKAQREEWWREWEYGINNLTHDGEPTLDEAEDIKWDAYCILIDIPPGSRIGRMFPMLPSDHHPPKEWPMEVIASVTTGRLLCKDLAEFIEFMVWFAGGWPDTFAGEMDKVKAHKLLVHCAAASLQAQHCEMQDGKLGKGQKFRPLPDPEDAKGISPVNGIVTIKALLSSYPKKLTIRPANFTELMKLSGAK